MLAVDEQDVAQEAALYRLLGKKTSRTQIRQKLFLEERAQGAAFSEVEGIEDSPVIFLLPAEQMATPSEETIDRIIEFALAQEPRVQEQLWSFLENPEGELDRTLEYLKEVGIITEAKKARTTATVSSLLRRHLAQNPNATFDELVQLVSREHFSRRPEALVRQFLRRTNQEKKL